MSKFLRALTAAKLDAVEVMYPEIVRGTQVLRDDADKRAAHLAFYPPEELRLLKGARNILMFAWEFSTLRTDAMRLSSHAFASQTSMLGLVDAVWTPSAYAAAVIRSAVDTPVEVVPAPIESPAGGALDRTVGAAHRRAKALAALDGLEAVSLSVLPRLQPQASCLAAAEKFWLAERIAATLRDSADAKIYLTVLNPHDARKGLRNAVEAFCRFAQEHEEAVWILKTSSHDDTPETINTRLLTHQLAREADMVGQYFSDNVLVCGEALSDEQLQALYALSDFYLCTSFAEGQNLPLQEAMASGVTPVSVDHTAMADYVTPENAIVIPSARRPLPPDVARKYEICGAFWFCAEAFDVYQALERSLALSAADNARLSTAAARTIGQRFSGEAVAARVQALLA